MYTSALTPSGAPYMYTSALTPSGAPSQWDWVSVEITFCWSLRSLYRHNIDWSTVTRETLNGTDSWAVFIWYYQILRQHFLSPRQKNSFTKHLPTIIGISKERDEDRLRFLLVCRQSHTVFCPTPESCALKSPLVVLMHWNIAPL